MSELAALPRLVIFDLDGVVYRGAQPVDGAVALIDGLHAAGALVRYATNNSMYTRAAYVERLAGMGITAEAEEIVTSTSATIEHLRAHLPDVRSVLALGAPGMLDEFRAGGFAATPAADAGPADWNGGTLAAGYDAVVAGLDPSVDYRRLGIAAAAIRAGSRFVATNGDVRYPTPEGLVPGAGAIIAALVATTGVEPVLIGKPQPAMFTGILERAGVGAEEALVIGDNPDADIVAANRAGLKSILVLTGVTDTAAASGLDGERRPTFVARDPAAVRTLLGLPVS